MWHDYPFSQRNKAANIVLGLEVGSEKRGEGWGSTKFEKGVRQYRWGLQKIGGSGTACQLWYKYHKI